MARRLFVRSRGRVGDRLFGIHGRSSATNARNKHRRERRFPKPCVQSLSDSVRSSHSKSNQSLSIVPTGMGERPRSGSPGVGVADAVSAEVLDSFEDTVRALNIEAGDDDAAIYYSSMQSIYFDMPVELWCEDNLVVRMTPMTARLYFPEDGPLEQLR